MMEGMKGLFPTVRFGRCSCSLWTCATACAPCASVLKSYHHRPTAMPGMVDSSSSCFSLPSASAKASPTVIWSGQC